MKHRVSSFLFCAALASCAKSGARNPSLVANDGSDQVVDASAGPALSERLAVAIAPLAQSPFGTGASVATVSEQGETSVALGTLNSGGPATTSESLFNVASVSKVLTAARIVSLAHVGRVELDAPVSKYLPGLRFLDANGVDQAGTITVRALVQHRSGLPHVPKDIDKAVAGRWSSPDLLRVLTDSWTIGLEGTPGQYKYSNTGYALLGAIVERVGNCSFADCMAGYLKELGMTRSTFWPAALGDGAASGRVEAKGTATVHPPGWYASRYSIPFTGLWTSMPELVRFGNALVAASRDQASPLYVMAKTGEPLGLFQNTRLGVASVEHDGSGPGFFAALILVPSKSIVLAVATNGGSEMPSETAAFTDIVAKAVNSVRNP